MRCATSASETVRPSRRASATAVRSFDQLPQDLLIEAELLHHPLVECAAVGAAELLDALLVGAAERHSRNRLAVDGGHRLRRPAAVRAVAQEIGNVERDERNNDEQQDPLQPVAVAPHRVEHGHGIFESFRQASRGRRQTTNCPFWLRGLSTGRSSTDNLHSNRRFRRLRGRAADVPLDPGWNQAGVIYSRPREALSVSVYGARTGSWTSMTPPAASRGREARATSRADAKPGPDPGDLAARLHDWQRMIRRRLATRERSRPRTPRHPCHARSPARRGFPGVVGARLVAAVDLGGCDF